MPQLRFFDDRVNNGLSVSDDERNWLLSIINAEGRKLGDINFIFLSDEGLLEINKRHLNRDYFTDTITFSTGIGRRVSGESYISLDRIKENAAHAGVNVRDELHRVLVHSLLHLMGYKDVEPEESKKMTSREDFYLNLRNW
ncbi:MAG: rRNA maturation RNase YbeY [Vicingaceae bacterium]